MKYLLDVVETYRVDSENEVDSLIENAKEDAMFTLAKYNCVQKERKQKGEIIDSWFKVSLYKRFTDEKEPDSQVSITYEGD